MSHFLINCNRRHLYFQDVRSTIDYIHIDTMDIKKRTIQDLPRYVKKDGRLLAMLKQIQDGGRTSFLVTNSDWWYTQHIMRFLLAEENSKDTGSLKYKVLAVSQYTT